MHDEQRVSIAVAKSLTGYSDW